MTMEANPYAAPLVADPSLADSTRADAIAAAGEAPFFSVSQRKLAVLALLTFNLYGVYWCAKQWGHIKRAGLRDISPFWRAIFAVFFWHDLFRRISGKAAEYELKPNASSPGDATFLVCFWIASSVLQRFAGTAAGLLGLIAIIPMVRAQGDINNILAKAAPGADPNARFSGWNWLLGIVVGSLIWLVVIIGIFAPRPPH